MSSRPDYTPTPLSMTALDRWRITLSYD